eukprot:s2344_g11.t1
MEAQRSTSGISAPEHTEVYSPAGDPLYRKQPLDCRIEWLEEDLAVLHRRVRRECSTLRVGSDAVDSDLRQLVARLEDDLAAERRARQLLEDELAVECRARQALEGRVNALESSIRREKKEREEAQALHEARSFQPSPAAGSSGFPAASSPTAVPVASGFPAASSPTAVPLAHWASASAAPSAPNVNMAATGITYPGVPVSAYAGVPVGAPTSYGPRGPQLRAHAWSSGPAPKRPPPLPPTTTNQNLLVAMHETSVWDDHVTSVWDQQPPDVPQSPDPRRGSPRPKMGYGRTRRTTPPGRATPSELLTSEALTRSVINGLDLITHIPGSPEAIKTMKGNLCTYAEQQVQLMNTMINAIENLGAAIGVFTRVGIPEVGTVPGHVGPVPVPGQALPMAAYANPVTHVPQPMLRSSAAASNPAPTIRVRGWPSVPH